MGRLTTSLVLVACLVLGLSCANAAAQGQPGGQLTIAFDTTIAPTFLYFAAPYEDMRLKRQ